MSITSTVVCDKHEGCLVMYEHDRGLGKNNQCPQCAKGKELEAVLRLIEELQEELENKE